MGTLSCTHPSRTALRLLRKRRCCALLLMLWAGAMAGQANAPLLLPTALAYDAAGNLFIAEGEAHLIQRLTPSGELTVVAGTGVQGFAGDGGPAILAKLDSPSGVALDAGGDLFIADTHNHAIRRVDAGSGVISTVVKTPRPVALAVNSLGVLVYADQMLNELLRADTGGVTLLAGNGIEGFAGDGGPATAASLDMPSGLAFDFQGNLFLADSHNQRVRRVDARTGIITTVAGSGAFGFDGEGAPAPGVRLALPRGLAVDAGGNVFVADSANNRVRRIDAMSGIMTTVAGSGVQGTSIGGTLAVGAALDTPRAVGLDGAGLTTLADTRNNRVAQVDAAQKLQTIAGVGVVSGVAARQRTSTVLDASLGTLVTSGKGVPAGVVQLVDGTLPLMSQLLVNGRASFTSVALSSGAHTLSSAYMGNGTYLPSTSAPMVVTIGSAPAADFTLATSGGTTAPSLPATFGFLLTPTGSPIPSTVQLSAAGLPSGSFASFNPAYLVPPTSPSAFTMTIGPAVAAGEAAPWVGLACAVLLLAGRRRRGVVCGLMPLCLMLTACGDRTNVQSTKAAAVRTYVVAVSATATSATGLTLLHTAQVTLVLAQ